jgi:hypothetical protein
MSAAKLESPSPTVPMIDPVIIHEKKSFINVDFSSFYKKKL